ncbi:hypothetical protein I315_06586 [Cryptococcus gattii Ru294]|nr:hypothetical protein I315_06586 [Cryptococcus gattii Ru294]
MSPHGRSLPQAIFRLTTNYMTPVLSAEESSHLHVYHPQMMLEACNSHHAINCIKIPQSEDEKSGDHRISNKREGSLFLLSTMIMLLLCPQPLQ